MIPAKYTKSISQKNRFWAILGHDPKLEQFQSQQRSLHNSRSRFFQNMRFTQKNEGQRPLTRCKKSEISSLPFLRKSSRSKTRIIPESAEIAPELEIRIDPDRETPTVSRGMFGAFKFPKLAQSNEPFSRKS